MSDPTPNIPDHLRREYTRGQLLEADLDRDPIAQFRKWFADAQSAGIVEPNVMSLATADAAGTPSARIVLLKGFDERGFVFHTNYNSRKSQELENNPRAALAIYWEALERQVRIEGTAEKISREESEMYFRTRPRGAQIGAWVSQQSKPLTSREELENTLARLVAKFGDAPVPLPEYWGGYRIAPTSIEFWQGRASRLHDRLLYTRNAAGGWTISRLSP